MTPAYRAWLVSQAENFGGMAARGAVPPSTDERLTIVSDQYAYDCARLAGHFADAVFLHDYLEDVRARALQSLHRGFSSAAEIRRAESM